MIKNYIKIAIRNFRKNKIHSFINIFSLSIGLVMCFLIILYIQSELSYDKSFNNGNRIYRVTTDITQKYSTLKMATSPPPLAFAIKREIPGVENATRLVSTIGAKESIISYKNNSFFDSQIYYADSTFFRIFSYSFLQGNSLKALSEPNSVVISAELSQKLFGKVNSFGKTFFIENNSGKKQYKVTGVFKNAETPTTFNADIFISMNSGGIGGYVLNNNNWAGNNFVNTFVELRKNTSPESIEEKFPALLNKYASEQLKQASFSKKHHLQALRNIHLTTSLYADFNLNTNILYIYIFSSLALLVLLIACINFMNLSTAKAGGRAREVGLRKVLGAQRHKLIIQFLSESILTTLLSFLVACVIVEMSLPVFNEILKLHLSIRSETIYEYVIGGFSIVLITGLLGGMYPAFYLSSFQPVKTLKGKIFDKFTNSLIKKILIVSQFVISIVFICATLVIVQQINYIQNKNLGFSKENEIIIPLRTRFAQEKQTQLRNGLLQLPEVKSTAATSFYPGIFILNDNQFYKKGDDVKEGGVSCYINFTDYDLFKTLNLDMLKGRAFSHNFPVDTLSSIVLNESAVKALGLSMNNIIGKKVKAAFNDKLMTYNIIGVVKNFNYQSLENKIQPLVFMLQTHWHFPYVIVNADLSNFNSFKEKLENIWRKYIPGVPFEFLFLKDEVNKQYFSYERTSRITSVFTFFAILIACLGLYGMVSHAIEMRTKEIGVRKVLGASALKITLLFIKEITLFIVVANTIALPLAIFLTHKWLHNFAYAVNPGLYIYLLAGIAMMLIALLTIGFQTIKAANSNPVKTLRYE